MSKKTIKYFFGPSSSGDSSARKRKVTVETETETLMLIKDRPSEKNQTLKEAKEKRSYNYKWEQDFPWLYYDSEHSGGFCKLCVKHAVNNNDKALTSSGGVFVTVPFTNYKNALGKEGKLNKHTNSISHIRSLELEKLSVLAVDNPIYNQILGQSVRECSENRENMSHLVRVAYFLAKEEIPHTTKYEPLIKRVIVKASEPLEMWIGKQSERSTYISKATASELICCASEVLDGDIMKEMCGKPFSVMADESTNAKNVSELSICVRYVKNNLPTEKFLTIITLPNTCANTIADIIDSELKSRNLLYENIVACGFDGASNMSGNKSGVRRLLSNKAEKDIPYIHCRAHILSLALTSMRNQYPPMKRLFHVLKDIYKLFHQSPKREHILHEIQTVLNDPVLKIPEATDIRWLSHHKLVNAVKRSYVAIMAACEHIHQDGADLSSLAGGILLSLRNDSFLITLCGLDEILSAISNLSAVLQSPSLQVSTLTCLVNGTKEHLKQIAASCKENYSSSDIALCADRILSEASNLCSVTPITEDKQRKVAMNAIANFADSVGKELSRRFNDTAIRLINGCSIFESNSSLLSATNEDIQNLCKCFDSCMINCEGVKADLKSFKYFAAQRNCNENPTTVLLETKIGYEHLKKLAELTLCIPISTASVERSFSSMNLILTKIRNKMGEDTLQHCMRISIESPADPSAEMVARILDNYARKKPRRIRLI